MTAMAIRDRMWIVAVPSQVKTFILYIYLHLST